MKTLNEIFLFLLFAAIILNALANENFTMDNITDQKNYSKIISNFDDHEWLSTKPPPPCIVDAPPYWGAGCALDFRCPCPCSADMRKKDNCTDGTPPDEFGNCPLEFWLEPDEEVCRIEWPRYPNGSCPEYITCPNCSCDCDNCRPAQFNGPCPSGTRADKYHHCRQILD